MKHYKWKILNFIKSFGCKNKSENYRILRDKKIRKNLLFYFSSFFFSNSLTTVSNFSQRKSASPVEKHIGLIEKKKK